MNKDSLGTYDMLVEYCRRTLGEPRKKGNTMVFPCPFGTHTRPKLEVDVRDGRGVWICRACNIGGDIFDLYALTHGLCPKKDFRKVMAGVADVLGVALDDSFTQSRRKGNRASGKVLSIQRTSHPQDTSPVFLPPEDEAPARKAIERMHTDHTTRDALAEELDISTWTLLTRAIFPELGALGITPDGRLLYVYTQRDAAGQLRITGCKLRRRDNHPNPCLKIEGGQWVSYGTMNSTEKNPHGIRFMFPAGKLYAPWGVASMAGKNTVILTEGESDALAVSESLELMREMYGMAIDEETGQPYEDEEGNFEKGLPAVVAIGGASGFPEKWAPLMRSKFVIIAFDGDEAGRKAAEHVRVLLSPVTSVCVWTPPDPYKDVREMLNGAGEKKLIASLMNATKREKQTA